MLLPLILIVLALLVASVLAYGTQPVWASFGPHGLDLILWSRRLEWPLAGTALLLCAGLLIVVISGKRRVFWLIGLLPILALFYHRFTAGPARGLLCVADPPFVSADRLSSLPKDDLVVGLLLNNEPFAFPCSELFRAPVIVRTGREKPLLLIWSANANRALAFTTDRDVKAEDLEIISSPDNALLIYNTRLGQFINGLTGKTLKNEIPTGFHDSIAISKLPWKIWKSQHPDTQVMALPAVAGDFSKALPQRDILPNKDADDRPITFVATTQPIAIPTEQVTEKPLNLTIGKSSLLLVRINGQVRAYSRELPGDLILRFTTMTDAKHPAVAWLDSNTNSEWNTRGEWVLGPADLHGTALTPIPVEDNLYWNVMKFWYPDLHLATEEELTAGRTVAAAVAHAQEKPTTRRRARSR